MAVTSAASQERYSVTGYIQVTGLLLTVGTAAWWMGALGFTSFTHGEHFINTGFENADATEAVRSLQSIFYLIGTLSVTAGMMRVVRLVRHRDAQLAMLMAKFCLLVSTATWMILYYILLFVPQAQWDGVETNALLPNFQKWAWQIAVSLAIVAFLLTGVGLLRTRAGRWVGGIILLVSSFLLVSWVLGIYYPTFLIYTLPLLVVFCLAGKRARLHV